MASIHRIRRKAKRDPIGVASLSDFRLREGRGIPLEDALAGRRSSLYTLDVPKDCLVFVRAGPGVDVEATPFYYQRQYETAEDVIVSNSAEVDALSERTWSPKREASLLYSVGRCGSTLLAHAFRLADGCTVLSEPDSFTRLLSWPLAERDELAWLRRLTAMSAFGLKEADHLVLKFRSMCTRQARLMQNVLPDARFVFITRRIDTYVASGMRSFSALGIPVATLDRLRRLPGVSALAERLIRWKYDALVSLIPAASLHSAQELVQLGAPGIVALNWLGVMADYDRLRSSSAKVLELSFEDLREDVIGRVLQVFSHCGISMVHAAFNEGYFEEDSQAGTPLSRLGNVEWELGPETAADIERLVAMHRDPTQRSG